MLSESMNSTRNFVFVVLVATQGIIGEQTTLDPTEGQTDEVLGLTTLSNRKGYEERTSSTRAKSNTTEEQTTRSDDISSSVLYTYETPTENNPETTKIVRNSAKAISEDFETSDDKITTDISHHSPNSHTVEHSIRKDLSNNNEIEVSEKNASDKKTTNKTMDDATAAYRYLILDTTAKQPHNEPVETTTMNYDDEDIDDYVERSTDQHTEKDINDFLKENDDVDVTKFYRRMFEISHSLEDSNNKPETVARKSTTMTSLRKDEPPLIHKEKSHRSYGDNSRMGHNENNQQSYEDHSRLSHEARKETKSHQFYDVQQNYPTPATPPSLVETNTHLGPYWNSQTGQFFTALSGQLGSFENEPRFTQARPQFNNNQRLNNPQILPPQFMQRPFDQLQPQLQQPAPPYHSQPQQLQQHYPMQLQYPWPTVQPVPNHMDNLLASLQQASLHPVMSAKQYKDFYEKQYMFPRNIF